MLWSRDREREAIDRLLDAVRAGRGGALLLHGEAGMGKSALLAYAQERAHDMRVLHASAAEAEADMAYATLHQLVRPVLPWVNRLPEPQAHALRAALGLELRDAPDRFLVSLATLTLLAEVAADRPVLCLFDDAHWADPASLEVVAFVARRLQADAVALLAARRSVEGPALLPAGAELRLNGLPPDAAGAFLDERWGAGLAAWVRDALVQAAAGNPLALIELPRTLTREQLLGRQPLPEPLPIAEGLERVLLERVRLTRPDLRTVALLCAAEGSGSLAAIERAAGSLGVDDPAASLAELCELIELKGSSVIFRHPLLRSAVYHGAGPTERRAAHIALTGAFAGQESEADRRAWHLGQAAVGPDEDVADELERSAGRVLRRSGHAAAAVALERAADLSLDDRDRVRRLVAAADAAWRGGDSSRCGALLDRAERLGAAEPALGLEARYLRGLVELRSGVPSDALAILLEGAGRAAEIDADLTLRLLSAAGEAAFQAGDQDAPRVIRRLMESLAVTGEPANLIGRLYLLVDPMTRGDAPASPHGDLARLEELDDPDLLSRAGGMVFGLGEYELARRLRARSVARARVLGAAGTLAWALRSLALDEMSRNRYLWAEACAAEGHRLSLETGQPNLACQHKAVLAEVAGLRGREQEARRLTADVLAEATGRGLHGTVSMVRRALGELALACGKPDDAIVHLEALWDAPSGQRGVAFAAIPDLVEAAARMDRPELALEHVPAYLSWAETSGSREAGALAARSRALLTGGEDADRLYLEALRRHPATERPLDMARTALLYGEHLRRERRRVDARAQLRAALETFERLGCVHWAERARSELRATGETARRRDPSSLDQLTQQELQVVRVVSQGATNREAAAHLFISPRTVDHHLRSVFRKLGIRSRAELVRTVMDGGLAGAGSDRVPR
jgi:DNA-binding CsgD family transcriptional regulator